MVLGRSAQLQVMCSDPPPFVRAHRNRGRWQAAGRSIGDVVGISSLPVVAVHQMGVVLSGGVGQPRQCYFLLACGGGYLAVAS
jgi:hypothetical protein